MKKLLFFVLIIFFIGCSNQKEEILRFEETKSYIEHLGDLAVDMSIGGDADAYVTLDWATDQKGLTKEKLEAHYNGLKEAREKRKLREAKCTGKTTPDYEWHCDGWWSTFTHDEKILNCLPQQDYGNYMKMIFVTMGKNMLVI